jgi:hypothetical protein
MVLGWQPVSLPGLAKARSHNREHPLASLETYGHAPNLRLELIDYPGLARPGATDL